MTPSTVVVLTTTAINNNNDGDDKGTGSMESNKNMLTPDTAAVAMVDVDNTINNNRTVMVHAKAGNTGGC